MNPAQIKRTISIGLAAACAVVTFAGPAASTAEATTVPHVCQSVPGSYPGATVSVGNTTVHVVSITNLYVCLYNYAVTTTGAPVPQLYSGCGTVCFKIDSPGASAAFTPYIRITFDADGASRGITYVPPRVSVGYTEPICVSVGTPAPACTSGLINLEE